MRLFLSPLLHSFFAVSLSVSRLVIQFGVRKSFGSQRALYYYLANFRSSFSATATITTSITLTLLFRPLGAVIFGLLSDRFGRLVSFAQSERPFAPFRALSCQLAQACPLQSFGCPLHTILCCGLCYRCRRHT